MGRKRSKLPTARLRTPFSGEQLSTLEIGTVVYLDGVIYTGREDAKSVMVVTRPGVALSAVVPCYNEES